MIPETALSLCVLTTAGACLLFYVGRRHGRLAREKLKAIAQKRQQVAAWLRRLQSVVPCFACLLFCW